MVVCRNSLISLSFKLIELLVVIAIIAVLAAILFPVFAQAKASAQSATCLSNMRQLGTAFSVYLGDSDGVYAAPYGNRYPNSAWVLSGNSPLVGTTSPPCPNANDTTDICNVADPTRGSLWPYTMSEKIYKCPTEDSGLDHSSGNPVSTLNQRITTTMNGNFATEKIPLNDGGIGTLAISESVITFPSATFMLVDEDVTSRNDGKFVPSTGETDVFGTQHHNGGNLVNADTSGKWYSALSFKFKSPMWTKFIPTRLVP